MPELNRASQRPGGFAGIDLRDIDCIARNVGGDNPVELAFGCQRQRNRTRACADIDRGSPGFRLPESRRDSSDDFIDENFSLRPRNQHALVHDEVQVTELSGADGVGEWCTGDQLLYGGARASGDVIRQGGLAIHGRP